MSRRGRCKAGDGGIRCGFRGGSQIRAVIYADGKQRDRDRLPRADSFREAWQDPCGSIAVDVSWRVRGESSFVRLPSQTPPRCLVLTQDCQ